MRKESVQHLMIKDYKRLQKRQGISRASMEEFSMNYRQFGEQKREGASKDTSILDVTDEGFISGMLTRN